MTLLANQEARATGDRIPVHTASTLIFPVNGYASRVYIICARKRFPVGYYDEEFTVYEAVPTPQTPGYFV